MTEAAKTSAQDVAARMPEVEEKVALSVDRIVEEGTPRLHRSWLDLLITGTVAGLEVSTGLIAMLYVEHVTGSALLGALAFSFGFVALLLGHSELFTEGFLVPVIVVAAKEARVRDLLQFWVGSATGNLVGGWGMMWIAMQAFPDLHELAVRKAVRFVDSGATMQSFCLAILAGSVITLMTRMHNGTDLLGVRVFVSVFAAFVLAGLALSHAILESLLSFAALQTGLAPFGYPDWLGWLGWTVLGNAVGGLGLVTLLRVIRSRELLAQHRRDVDS